MRPTCQPGRGPVVLEALLHLVAELAKLRGRTVVHHDVAEEQVHVLQHSQHSSQLQTRLHGSVPQNVNPPLLAKHVHEARKQHGNTGGCWGSTRGAHVEEGLRRLVAAPHEFGLHGPQVARLLPRNDLQS